MTASSHPVPGGIAPDRWPTEIPLFVTVAIVSAMVWVLLVVSVVGILYAVLFGLFLFASHLIFVARIRGSGVRLGPDQFPELHRRVEDLARGMDMEPPAAYLQQAGGTLNAFATRFLGRNIVVLYSDLLEACGDNDGARDMIIAHELGHLRCGHLRWTWLIFPGYIVPFLGSALSRAREHTSDRFGLAGAGSVQGAMLGLAILSAGAKFGPRINLGTFARQRSDTNTGWMTIGEWLSSHPPLSKRVVAINPAICPERFHPTRGRAMALAILAATAIVGGGLTFGAATLGSGLLHAVEQAANQTEATPSVNVEAASAQVQTDFETLSRFIAQEWPDGAYPADIRELHQHWSAKMETPFPIDPFDGYEYGYDQLDHGYRLWSSGPDGTPDTDDNITVERP